MGSADDQVKTMQTSEIDAGALLFSRNLPGGEEGLSNSAVRHLLRASTGEAKALLQKLWPKPMVLMQLD